MDENGTAYKVTFGLVSLMPFLARHYDWTRQAFFHEHVALFQNLHVFFFSVWILCVFYLLYLFAQDCENTFPDTLTPEELFRWKTPLAGKEAVVLNALIYPAMLLSWSTGYCLMLADIDWLEMHGASWFKLVAAGLLTGFLAPLHRWHQTVSRGRSTHGSGFFYAAMLAPAALGAALLALSF
jgi:uncharacterized membrane protein